MVINNNLGQKIGSLREKAGLTQTDLAKMLRVSRSAVSYWEMSLSNPSLSNMVAMARLFNVSVDYLLSVDNREMIDISELNFEEKKLYTERLRVLKTAKSDIKQ